MRAIKRHIFAHFQDRISSRKTEWLKQTLDLHFYDTKMEFDRWSRITEILNILWLTFKLK